MLRPESVFDRLSADATALEPHAPFLVRCAAAREAGDELGARLALGGYLSLRLADRAAGLDSDPDPEVREGFRWQLSSAHRYVDALPKVDCVESSHLEGLVRAAGEIEQEGSRRLRVALIAFSWQLEHEGRLEEGLDALATSVPFYAAPVDESDVLHLGMTAGRLHRTLAHWELADRGYALAQEWAERHHDRRSVLLARLGLAKVQLGRGNLPDARQRMEGIIAEAEGKDLADTRAWAYADVAVVLDRMGCSGDSLLAQYQAFAHFRDSHERLRVLGSLGVGLRVQGAHEAARHAFETILRASTDWVVRQNAVIELMALHTELGDELAFRRYKQEADANVDRMAPNMAVDYRVRVAEGVIRFGRRAAGLAWLQQARQVAERHQLNDWYFRVDGMISALRSGDSPSDAGRPHHSGEIQAGVAEVAEKLLSYVGA